MNFRDFKDTISCDYDRLIRVRGVFAEAALVPSV